MQYTRTIELENREGNYRRINCYIHDNKEFRFNFKYKVFVSPDGEVLDEELNIVNLYDTHSNHSDRAYKAFNIAGYKRVYLHRIIAYLYVTGYSKELFVDHIDNNPQNNYPSNLQYLTNRENTIKECGSRVIVTNLLTKEDLHFNCKKDFFDYFKISSANIYFMIKDYHLRKIPLKQFLPCYIEDLKLLIDKYKEEGNDAAARSCENLIQMIKGGWIVKQYQYHLK